MENIQEIKDYMIGSVNVHNWNERRDIIKEKHKDNPELNKILTIIDGSGLIKKCRFTNEVRL